jgi:hypothetical protein
MNEQARKQIPIKRRDIGVAGAAIVVAEVLSNFQSSQNVASEIQKFKEEFQASKVEREQFFVRKAEVEKISTKLDQVSDQITQLNTQVVSLKSFLKNRYGYSAMSEDEPDPFGPTLYVCIDPMRTSL